MAGEFNPGFHHHHHHHQQQGVLYTSGGGGVSSSSSGGSGGYDLIPMANYYNSPGGSLNLGAAGDGSPRGLQLLSAQNNPVGPSSSSLLLDSVPGLKHDTGLAVEWSVEEQYKLEEGLANHFHG